MIVTKMSLCAAFLIPILASPFSYAQDELTAPLKISLKDIIYSFDIGADGHFGIPIGSAKDIVLTAQQDRPRLKPMRGTFPIQSFAISPDNAHMIVEFHPAEIPERSDLKGKKILIAIKSGQAKVEKVLDPKVIFEGAQATGDVHFITSEMARFELFMSTEPKLKVDYGFYNLESRRVWQLSDLMPHPDEVLRLRALTEDAYLLMSQKNQKRSLSVVWMDMQSLKVRQITELNLERTGDPGLFIHNLVDERELRTNSQGQIWISYSHYDKSHGWETRQMRISASGEVEYLNGEKTKLEKTVHGEPELTFIGGQGEIRLVRSNGLSRRWKLNPSIEYFGDVQRFKGGYVFRHRNHPRYGYILLNRDGSWKELTPERFRLIHQQVSESTLAGLEEAEKGSVNLHIIPLGGCDTFVSR